MLTAKDILQALRILKSADPKTVQQLLADEAVNKASGERHAQGLDGAPWIADLHTEGEEHRVITGEEIRTGPSQAASGGGAEKMIREYSAPAPQKGVTQEAMSLAEVLGGISRSMKAMADGQKTMSDLLTVLVAAKAEEKEEKEEEKDKEEEEAKAHAKGRATELVAEAQKLLRKADRKEEDGDDEEESEKSRVLYREAKLLRKQAARMLGKARLHALAAGDGEITKSIRQIVAKNDLVIKAENEEEEKERETEKDEADKARQPDAAAAKGAEATKDSAGNQAPKQDKENGNQDDAAQKAVTALGARVDEALKGLTILHTDLAGFMDTVAGKAKPQEGVTAAPAGATPMDAFALMKANPAGAAGELQLAIEKAASKGLLDGAQAMTAYNILAKLDACNKGVIAKSMVDGMIDNAPSAVRQIFRHAA